MMKKIIYTRPDGGLSVCVPSEGARLAFNEKGELVTADSFFHRWPVEGVTVEWAETEDEFVERISRKDVPADATNVQIVDASVIPSERTFRNAWTHCPINGCKVDMAKAREIHKSAIRELRKPLLAALDVAYMRADEVGDAAAKVRVASEKQALRDATAHPAIAAAKTPAELKAASLEILTAKIVAPDFQPAVVEE